MGLDSFMGTPKKSKKKRTQKSTKKLDEEDTEEIEDDDFLDEDQDDGNQDIVDESSDNSKISFVTIHLTCTSKCGYKKTMKRAKSFVPKEKDLLCPKCKNIMKVKKN